MLGLADREAVFDLMEAVMAGKPAAALAITDRAYERGADLGTLLQDLLELLHTVTRLKSVPALRDSPDLPETERTRGAALAERLTVPTLARAWQMLLKGVGEVETAPDRRAAAEMVLIRLCHVADLPPPGDLVRRLTGGAPRPPAPRRCRAVALRVAAERRRRDRWLGQRARRVARLAARRVARRWPPVAADRRRHARGGRGCALAPPTRRRPRRSLPASATSPRWWRSGARRCCTRIWCTRSIWCASPRR